MPLHASEPSAGLKVDGSKLEMVSPEIEGVLEARPSHAVVQRDARVDLPRVGGVRLDVPPPLLDRPFGLVFR